MEASKFRVEKVTNTRNSTVEYYPQVLRTNEWFYIVPGDVNSLVLSAVAHTAGKCTTEAEARNRIKFWRDTENQFGVFSTKVTEYIYID